MKRKRFRKNHGNVKKVLFFLAVISISLLLVVALAFKFMQGHFMYNTYIEGVNCSLLTVEDAKLTLETSLKERKMILKFENDKQYEVEYSDFDFHALNSEELAEILTTQNILDFNRKEYSLTDTFTINQVKLEKYLTNIEELQPENMIKSQNASLQFNSDQLLEIVPEIYGNYIEFEEACEVVKKSILSGEENVDFTARRLEPEIVSTNSNLQRQQKTINSILETTINFELSDKSIYTLDKGIMAEWVYQTEDGFYEIELENNILNFIRNLNQEVSKVNSSMKFSATDLGDVDVLLQNNVKALVNEEAEFDKIMEELGTATTINRSPIYDKKLLQDNFDTYIELDITRQKVWMYVNGKCILNTLCVTGSVGGGHFTPTGIYYLTYKTTNATLRGYNDDGSRYAAKVSYWMPFNGDIGFHDASWRHKFGGEIYKTGGSHGCVNLPSEAAKTLYQNIDSTIPIIIYQS